MTQEEINKAANAYTQEIIDSNTFDVNFEEDNYDAGSLHATSEICPIAFKAGVLWRINSVWHDVDKEPKQNAWFIAQIGDDCFDTFVMKIERERWKRWCKGMNIQRWAYIDDLLPTKGGAE